MKYAESTSVSSEKSRNEIEKTLSRYGALGFLYGWQENSAVIIFRMNGRHVQFVLPLPDKNAKEFILTPARRSRRSSEQIESAYEQAVRQRWRALALVIKAKLEAVESGITVFDDEFLAHIVLPSGATIGQWMRPQIDKAYATGEMPALFPLLTMGKGAAA
jgi:hypothetical protein